MLSSCSISSKFPYSLFSLSLYHKNVEEHFKNPKNIGSMDPKDENVGTALVGAPACGDALKLQIRVDKDGKITDAKFRAFGCPAAVASSSLATVMLKGKTLDEALKIKNTVIANELQLPPVKVHCSMLAQDAIQQAVASYKTKHDSEKAKSNNK